MPTHHDFHYVRVEQTWECVEGCPLHGPFPTPWRAVGSEWPAVTWSRYTGPHTVEQTTTKAPPPAEKAP